MPAAVSRGDVVLRRCMLAGWTTLMKRKRGPAACDTSVAGHGRHEVTDRVANASGETVAEAHTSFDIASSADSGAGLSGKIAAAWSQIHQGETRREYRCDSRDEFAVANV